MDACGIVGYAQKLREKIKEPLSSNTIRNTFGIQRAPPKKRPPRPSKYTPVIGPTEPDNAEVPPLLRLPDAAQPAAQKPPPRALSQTKPKIGDLDGDTIKW